MIQTVPKHILSANQDWFRVYWHQCHNPLISNITDLIMETVVGYSKLFFMTVCCKVINILHLVGVATLCDTVVKRSTQADSVVVVVESPQAPEDDSQQR